MTNVPQEELVDEGALPPDDFHDAIERIREVADYRLIIPPDLVVHLEKETGHLLLDRTLLPAAASALQVGHLVLQGPPGTGKSSLARALCRAFHCSMLPVTAHEDWTTYEVIGRQTLIVDENGHEKITPTNGFFTEAVIRCAGQIVRNFDDPAEPQATWLLIDELNRAHLDRAFGELFTVLGTDELLPITLQYQIEGNQELVTPRRFRLIATLNTVDRQFVNSLGQGLKRRFTFLTVDVPSRRDENEPWGSDQPDASPGSLEFSVVAERAAARVAERRAATEDIDADIERDRLTQFLLDDARHILEFLFDFTEKVRYASKGAEQPYLPIGTAHLIDTVELFLSRVLMGDLDQTSFHRAMDWAVSVKLAPLFDTDTISPGGLEEFANSLEDPFNSLTRRELLQIVAVGQYYVEP